MVLLGGEIAAELTQGSDKTQDTQKQSLVSSVTHPVKGPIPKEL